MRRTGNADVQARRPLAQQTIQCNTHHEISSAAQATRSDARDQDLVGRFKERTAVREPLEDDGNRIVTGRSRGNRACDRRFARRRAGAGDEHRRNGMTHRRAGWERVLPAPIRWDRGRCVVVERLTNPSEQGMRPPDAATKTVRQYGEELQRSYGGFVRHSYPPRLPSLPGSTPSCFSLRYRWVRSRPVFSATRVMLPPSRPRWCSKYMRSKASRASRSGRSKDSV
ncbi:MAG: hypothetical protein V7631_1906 [Massilia sp.]